jgi:transcriptional regulator with XRE-family HTH domain
VRDLRPALGARIKELRTGLGISQEALAERASLHWTYISDLERGRQTPTVDVVNRLARALGVTLAEFFSVFDESYRLRFRKERRDLKRVGRS